MSDLPVTTKIRPRPVWERHYRRILSNVNPLPPPSEREKQDAIRVLADPGNQLVPGLWDEAHRIFEEASR